MVSKLDLESIGYRVRFQVETFRTFFFFFLPEVNKRFFLLSFKMSLESLVI